MMKPLIRSENTMNDKEGAMNEDNNTMIVRKIVLTHGTDVYEMEITDQLLSKWNDYIDYTKSESVTPFITRKTVYWALTIYNGNLNEEYEKGRKFDTRVYLTQEAAKKIFVNPDRLIGLYDLISTLYEIEIYDHQINSDSDVDYTENEIGGYDPNEDDDNSMSVG